MSPFGGFLMPIQYSSILDEHHAVRHALCMFDLSHMGQFVLTGEEVPGWLDGLTSNEVATMRPHQARYNIFTNERGGAHDDVIIYRMPDRWLVIVNASNSDKIWNLLHAAQTRGISLENRTPDSALIALQGPRAQALLQPHCDADLAALRYYYATEATIAGARAEVARTGYTGEDGFELFVSAAEAPRLWNQFLLHGKPFGLRPAGLGARDVLRLEAGMPLYGHELDEEITPIMAGLQWVVKFGKGDFPGKAALQAQREADDYERIVGLIMDGKAPARAGYPVFLRGERVGEVRSGAPAPSVGGKNIATALPQKQAAEPGTQIEVEIRGTRHGARIVPLPFYKRAR